METGGGVDRAELRDAQRECSAVPNMAMAVTLDIGDPKDEHPKNKKEVGRRLALAAARLAYGRDVVFSGPLYRQMRVQGRQVRIAFDHAAGGLEAKGGQVDGFTIAGEDRRFVPAEGRIDGEEVVVSAKAVPAPRAVRYAWANYPRATLQNKAGLPASGFRTDAWPLTTARRMADVLRTDPSRRAHDDAKGGSVASNGVRSLCLGLQLIGAQRQIEQPFPPGRARFDPALSDPDLLPRFLPIGQGIEGDGRKLAAVGAAPMDDGDPAQEVGPPLDRELRIRAQLDLRSADVVEPLEAVNDRTALDGDLAPAVANIRMGQHPLDRHVELQQEGLAGGPSAIDAGVAVRLRGSGSRT